MKTNGIQHLENSLVMSVKFKWDKTPSFIIKSIKDQLDSMMDEARTEVANYLYKELISSSPKDTGTFKSSWMSPEKTKKGYKLVNALPATYIASGRYHRAGEPIVDPYNLFILEGDKAGAPIEYTITNHMWEYRNIASGQLQDVNILLWKFNQGALGLNPYTLLNQLFSKKVRSNI